MAPAHRIEIFHGNEVEPWLDAVARLRIAVFRDWPYLYEGAPDYEKEYLATYAKSPGSVFVLAIDGDEVVGASTGLPLADETDAFKSPFIGQDIAIGDVFYFGESVLLPGYRGGGIGHAFFDAREARACELGLGITAFCAVDRGDDDPRRPAGLPQQQGVLDQARLRAPPRHDDAAGMERDRPWRDRPRADFLAA